MHGAEKNQLQDNPYLSIVIVSRNDNHSANMYRRMQVCIDGIISQMERKKISSELILVEWIPPNGRPLIKDIYSWPSKLGYCRVRTVVVPSSTVGNYDWSEDYSIRDLTPWNVGIRRARGEFILSTVIDILLSEELVDFFANKKLEKDKMYRIDRCDVNRRVLDITTIDEQLKYCEQNIIDMYTPGPFEFLLKRKIPILHDKAPGDFMLFSRERWHLIHGFPEGISPGADDLLLYMAHLSGAKQYVFKKPLSLYHIDHDSKWKKPSYVFLKKVLNKLKLPYHLVEILAGVGCKFIPSKSYLDKANIVYTQKDYVKNLIIDMVEGRRSYVYNGDNWGLGDKQMEEFIVVGARM